MADEEPDTSIVHQGSLNKSRSTQFSLRAYYYTVTRKISPEFWLNLGMVNTMYLLTEWDGQTGKYLARGQDVWTERSEVRAS